MDYESIEAAMEGLCSMFEQKLKAQNPHRGQITYDIADLYDYIDALPDLSCLVLENTMYAPCNKAWVKEHLLRHLKRLAGR